MYPTLCTIGPLTIYSYGCMIAAGVLVSLLLVRMRIITPPVSATALSDYMLLMLFSGIAGARLLYVTLHYDEFQGDLFGIIRLWEGGLILYGGVVVATLVLFIAARIKRISFIMLTDALVPFLALAQGFGRIGCFLNGCCWGRPSSGPFAVVVPALGHAVHPVQLYEAGYCIILFAVLVIVYRSVRVRGAALCAYFFLYPLGRFMLEYVRGDQDIAWFGMTLAQLTSIGLMAGALVMGIVRMRKAHHGRS